MSLFVCVSQGTLQTSALDMCRELEKAAAEKAELVDALAVTSEALRSAKGAWERGAAWERGQLGPQLQQHDTVLGSCETQLLAVVDTGAAAVAPGASRGEVVQRVVQTLSAVRHDLRACWQELLGEEGQGAAAVRGGAAFLTPALVRAESPAGLRKGVHDDCEV